MAGAGQFVTVMGEGGVGKSRLLYEFRHALDRSTIAIREGRCQSYGQATPYLPWMDAARRALPLHEDDAPDQRLDKVVTNIQAIDPSLEQFLPHYLHLFSIPSTQFPLPPTLQGEALKRALEEALAATYILYAQHGPMVVIFADWHWADEASDAALHYLISVAGAYPILLIVLYRPSEYHANWGTLSNHTAIHLSTFSAAHVAYSAGILACLYGYTGQFRKAYLSAKKALELSQHIANKTRMALSLVYTGVVQLEQGSFAASIAHWTDSAERCQQMGSHVIQGVAMGSQGYAVFMLDDAATGVQMLQSGIDLIESTGSRFCLSWLYGCLAECQALAGNAAEAVSAAEKCLEVRCFGDRWKEQQAYRALALAAALGPHPDWQQVEGHIAESLRLAEGKNARPDLAITCFRYATLLRDKGDHHKAQELPSLQRATDLFQEMTMMWWCEKAEQWRPSLTSPSSP